MVGILDEAMGGFRNGRRNTQATILTGIHVSRKHLSAGKLVEPQVCQLKNNEEMSAHLDGHYHDIHKGSETGLTGDR